MGARNVPRVICAAAVLLTVSGISADCVAPCADAITNTSATAPARLIQVFMADPF